MTTTDFSAIMDARIDALVNRGKEDFESFYAANAARPPEEGYVWVVLNHGDQYAREASGVASVHATLPLALRSAEAILKDQGEDDLIAQPFNPNTIDVLAGDCWVQITREEVQA